MEDKTITPLFPGLDKNELRLLCYLACVGTEKNVSLVATGYRRRFRLTQQTYDDEIQNLRLAGYIAGGTYVNPDWHLSVFLYLQDNHQDWVKIFKELNGFAGKPDNDTVKEMRKRYPMYEFHSIEVDHPAKASMDKINAFILEHNINLVAGTSLGGYYAMCSKFEGPKPVINPVTDPVRDLRQFLGQNSYKPGRPDGQTDFIFTEEMLMEFGELELQPLEKVVCHYTPHDQLLGEAIKEDYVRMFPCREEISEDILPSHFLTFRYVKTYMGTILNEMLDTPQ